jgi:hypothetical protein
VAHQLGATTSAPERRLVPQRMRGGSFLGPPISTTAARPGIATRARCAAPSTACSYVDHPVSASSPAGRTTARDLTPRKIGRLPLLDQHYRSPPIRTVHASGVEPPDPALRRSPWRPEASTRFLDRHGCHLIALAGPWADRRSRRPPGRRECCRGHDAAPEAAALPRRALRRRSCDPSGHLATTATSRAKRSRARQD